MGVEGQRAEQEERRAKAWREQVDEVSLQVTQNFSSQKGDGFLLAVLELLRSEGHCGVDGGFSSMKKQSVLCKNNDTRTYRDA